MFSLSLGDAEFRKILWETPFSAFNNGSNYTTPTAPPRPLYTKNENRASKKSWTKRFKLPHNIVHEGF